MHLRRRVSTAGGYAYSITRPLPIRAFPDSARADPIQGPWLSLSPPRIQEE